MLILGDGNLQIVLSTNAVDALPWSTPKHAAAAAAAVTHCLGIDDTMILQAIAMKQWEIYLDREMSGVQEKCFRIIDSAVLVVSLCRFLVTILLCYL